MRITYRGKSVRPEPFRLEVVTLGTLQVVVMDHVRLALVVAQNLATRFVTIKSIAVSWLTQKGQQTRGLVVHEILERARLKEGSPTVRGERLRQ